MYLIIVKYNTIFGKYGYIFKSTYELISVYKLIIQGRTQDDEV